MTATAKEMNLQLLAFDGNKSTFGTWEVKFMGLLDELTAKHKKEYLNSNDKMRPEPLAEYKEWLETEPEIPKKYSESNITTVTRLLKEYVSAPTKDFKKVEELYTKMNTDAEELTSLLILGALPAQYYGGQTTFDPESFRPADVERKMIAIFGDKSKKEIMSLNPDKEPNREKFQVNQINTKKRKASDATPGGECFYCLGEFNFLNDGKKHKKHECKKRQEDFAAKRFRRNITEKFKSGRREVSSNLIHHESAQGHESTAQNHEQERDRDVRVDTVDTSVPIDSPSNDDDMGLSNELGFIDLGSADAILSEE
ncbi:hypothetical protein SPRG_22367 [Saprolegnia parasitica CBS 223.65]|uniref:Uncharacterized protein n=1 Tax=Saprolegnia parasitica (strain CBS 223.65) TaxID=695850 RepID=A0A067BUK3_SAPPC|nr:hypothetical protein SPRG_22367 [Saprolegnia parasitica CBS 223.65]KDO18287.1 hypothetical protein SPRG_22367 [Saprolegnia parasitica CBS 223.65]|eukprot:XP_012211005.1 hypothetical protein SPRG_22367 [Saprolegnia parasitica CBS 223.65]